MNSLIDDRAMEDDEDDVSFDEETGEVKSGRRNGENGFDDSSEEDDDDDEEEEQRIRQGFIVDEDEDDDEESRRKRRREKRKRPREDREEEGLDEDDLELIGMKPQREESGPKLKRLKRGRRESDDGPRGGVDDIFADEVEEQEERRPRNFNDEFDDFIEDDVFSDDEGQRAREDLEVAPARRRGLDASQLNLEGFTQAELEDFRLAFGDGHDYDFALEKEFEDEEAEKNKNRHLELKDVFEHSQLKEKMLTEEDTAIRQADAPERFQLARKPYAGLELTEDEFKEEANWISQFIWPTQQARLSTRLLDAFKRSVLQALEFMVNEQFEVPYIATNRKDYFIHVHTPHGQKEEATQLLRPKELWSIFELDLKFRALIERRRGLQRIHDELKSTNTPPDTLFEQMLSQALTLEELQDLHDYLHFRYAAQIKDLALTNNGEANGVALSQKKAHSKTLFEHIRQSRAEGMVRGYGISADDFAKNVTNDGPTTYSEDPSDGPMDLADSLIDDNFNSGAAVIKSGRALFAEEITTNPRFRKYVRSQVYSKGVFDCYRTERGLRRIDESHPYYEFKYLRNQTFQTFVNSPATFLRMLKAEEEGLIEVKVRIHNSDSIKRDLAHGMKTDNYSDAADAWNKEREQVVSMAWDKTLHQLGRLVKETLKSECEDRVAEVCREEFDLRLDQAPYNPPNMHKGTTPRALAMSIGRGIPGKDKIHWVYIGDDGRPADHGSFVELAPGDESRSLPEGKDVVDLLDLIRDKEVEVIGVAGFTPDTRKVVSHLNAMVEAHKLQAPSANPKDAPDKRLRYPDGRLEVIIVNDEVARIYHTSEKARKDHAGWDPLSHYCYALARYLQDPLKEYASLGNDIISLTFHRAQQLLPREKLMRKLEMALVDKVNLVGVEVNEAAADSSLAALLPYVCGLGPRKAQHLISAINSGGGYVLNRENLLINANSLPPLTPKVWNNAASTLYISYDDTDEASEFLDSTRIHPEDYDIARKMAADALELDEEDIEAERQEYGSGAILKRLIREGHQDRVNDLLLEQYAVQLEQNLNAKKRSTLETIRAELQEPFEELRHSFNDRLDDEDVFTMLTSETNDSLQVGMNVPITLKRIADQYVEGVLDCGMVAAVESDQWHDDPNISPKQLFSMHQTVQAHLTSINRKEFSCSVSLREDSVKKPFKRFDPEKELKYEEWDARAEATDKKSLQQQNPENGHRATRVIKHPLFQSLNSKQAEEYLGSQGRGHVVIRPSSKGTDHLAVTWKVGDGIFQHIDVLELDKDNEFSLGRKLNIGSGGRYSYSDLDELINAHVQAMAKRVEEMVNSDKFQDKTKSQLEEWLNTYTAANPKRSMYQFCLNRERPGYFHLIFKAGQKAKIVDWPVKVTPEGFELKGQAYPNVKGLSNGFKMVVGNMQSTANVLGVAALR